MSERASIENSSSQSSSRQSNASDDGIDNLGVSPQEALRTRLPGFSRRQTLAGLAAGGVGLALGGVLGCSKPEVAGKTEAGKKKAAGTSGAKVTMDLGVAAPGASLSYPYALPPLGFAFGAIEAVVDARTMEIHHDRHHQGYTDKLNAALESEPSLQGKTLFELLGGLGALPESTRTAIGNNGGGYLNHSLFWPLLKPGGASAPKGELASAINANFGSVDAVREKLAKQAGTVFGSGWAWLVAREDGTLIVRQYANQDTPLRDGFKPILGIDVWEHAYYLKYQNRRAAYVKNLLGAINWSQAEANYRA